MQTDFGLTDGAVASMHGVAYTLCPDIQIEDLTHEIPAYDIRAAAYRLYQTITYWPTGTVFVSVIDPGVGGLRKSVVCLTETGHYVITPDNGSLTFIAQYLGLKEVRQIDETVNRLNQSTESHTFHGRDVYAYNGARLACGQIQFAELGRLLPINQLIKLPLILAKKEEKQMIGRIDSIDSRFGSLWTNIPLQFLKELAINYQDPLVVTIYYREVRVHQQTIRFVKAFADVPLHEPLVYINSLLNVAVAINQGSFVEVFNIGSGNDWIIKVSLQ